jgi:RsiW-degrading membrane proteinase PrsW (M82 family)
MYTENNLAPLLCAMLPVFLYIFLFYKFIPKGFINPRRSKRYFVIGLLSPTIVGITYYVFPGLQISESGLLFYCIFQIALLEEFTKYITYWWTTTERKSYIHDYPIATMCYVMLASLGFALVENIHYLMAFGDPVLFMRGITAIVLHMLCGVIMGYFVAKSREVKDTYPQPKDQYERLINDYVNYGRYLLLAAGLMAASLVHGIYDYNLFLLDNIYSNFTLVVILLGGLSIGYFMIKELVRDSTERRKNASPELSKDSQHLQP